MGVLVGDPIYCQTPDLDQDLKSIGLLCFTSVTKRTRRKTTTTPLRLLKENPFQFLEMKISAPSTDVDVNQEEGGNAEKVVI